MKDTETLQRNVLNELAWDPKVDSSHIGVTVQDSTVTLSGYVHSYAEKIAAETAAQRIRGALAVVNELEVRLLDPMVRGDHAIAEAAVNALKWNVTIPANAIKLTVHNGWIEMTGEVPWFFQRKEAERAVRHLYGVKGVFNRIEVKQPVAPAQVKERIEAAFQRNAQLDAGYIKVKVNAGKVTLQGNVNSWAERKQAELAAWSAPGVTEVINELSIAVPIPLY